MADDGGEDVCWLDRVCDACGSIVDGDVPHVCRPMSPAMEITFTRIDDRGTDRAELVDFLTADQRLNVRACSGNWPRDDHFFGVMMQA